MSVLRHRVTALMVLLMIAAGGLSHLRLHNVVMMNPWMPPADDYSPTIHTQDPMTVNLVNSISGSGNRTIIPPNRAQTAGKVQNEDALGLVPASTPELAAYLQNLSHQPCTSLTPWPNVTSVAYYPGRFYSGYRNQMMGFTMLILHTLHSGHGQLLLPSIYMKDTYGTNRVIRFQDLWDIPHFNSFYPALPRLVDHDPILHEQFNPQTTNYPWFRNANHSFCNAQETFCTEKSPVRPHALGDKRQFLGGYIAYAKGKGKFGTYPLRQRHPAEILMLQTALRPHPQLQSIWNEKRKELVGENNKKNNQNGTEHDYMTLHARVEPDMQHHPICPEKKVINLTGIFQFLESTWKDPPVAKVFMPVNRQLLEQAQGKRNAMADHNLKELNRVRDYGLWNGRTKVYEFGSHALQGTPYEKKPSTPGAMLNFFLSVDAKIFVGTEVSSYSHDVLATRFFRGYMDNYKYLPQGLVHWTPPGTAVPPGFSC